MRLVSVAALLMIVLLAVSAAVVRPIGDSSFVNRENDPPFLETPSHWADSIFETLTPDERTAQLFMVAAYSNKDSLHVRKVRKLITDYKIGGLIFMQGGPVRQANLTNLYQSYSKVPLLVSIDGEWGLSMRLDSTVKYPWQMTLGAIQDEQLIYKMGADIGRQCKRLGIHVNFAPVVDVNVNPKNPIINARSFGENKYNVASKGIAYMKGMQSTNIIANAKHFPGHGDTDKDSHKSLPTINHTKERIDSIELFPFHELINSGLASMMVAHLYIPAYVKQYNTATTLSREVVTNLLQDSLGFKGLIFTDALNMRGVSSFYRPGVVDVKALLAGNDVLLFSEDVPTAIKEINVAIRNGEISREEIDRRCLKILRAKQWVGLNDYRPVDLDSLYSDLNANNYELLNRHLTEASLTVLKNKEEILPIRNIEKLKVACLSVGENSSEFQESLSLYTSVDQFSYSNLNLGASKLKSLLDTLVKYDLVIFSIHKSNKNPWKSYKVSSKVKEFFGDLEGNTKVVLSLFANPYSLIDFELAEKADALIMGYQNSTYAQKSVAQLIFGGIGANGKLPVSVSSSLSEGAGVEIKPLNRFKYTIPEEVGIQRQYLHKIDSIAIKGIREHAYPGCQVFVAKDGKVIYNKSFGHHTYERKREVRNSDIYDLASVTKISASVLAAMVLEDLGRFSLDLNLCDYLYELIPDTSIYTNLNLREILAHQSGLQGWVPFYQKTLIKGMPRYEIYSLDSSSTYPHRVANNLYIHKDYPDTIYQRILRGPIKEKKYRYSDLGYYFMMKIIEKQTGQRMDDYVGKIYDQLGMTTTGYLPRKRFDIDRIPPTEYDMIFRKQLIKGDVHDPGSAMLGGVGGHAGVFSNANDLAKLMQMYLNEGTYGGVRYIDSTTIQEYTSCQFCDEGKENRRAAGFDKPFLQGYGGPTCDGISQNSYGHSGFTGTMAWVDPDEEIVYIFLSNRVYPDAKNKKLLNLNIRTDIQQVIYDAIKKSAHEKINE